MSIVLEGFPTVVHLWPAELNLVDGTDDQFGRETDERTKTRRQNIHFCSLNLLLVAAEHIRIDTERDVSIGLSERRS